MKKILFFALVTLICSSSSCKSDPTPIATDNGILSLTFKPTYDSKPLIINKIYDYNGKKVRFTKWQFLVTSPLACSVGQACPTTDEAILVDLTTLDDSLKSIAGFKTSFNNLSLGNFTTLSMGLGVSKELNAKKPNNFPRASPLSDAGNFWDGWQSYIFSKLEGLMDKDGDGKFETGFTLHTGGDASFRNITFTSEKFQVTSQANAAKTFEVNLNTLLRGIDLTAVNSTHQTGDEPTMLKMMDNLSSAFSVK